MKADGLDKSIELAREPDFTLGELRVRPSLREVASVRATEVLEPRVMQVMVALARRAGEVVARDELVQQCWDGRVVGDDAVSRCITRLRRLGETHRTFAVETIARVGYRLTTTPPASETSVAEPTPAVTAEGSGDAGSGTVPPAPVSPPSAASDTRHRRRFKPLTIAGIIFVLLAALYLGTRAWQASTAERFAESQTVAEILALVEKDQYGQAFTLARPLIHEGSLRGDAGLQEAWRQLALPMRPLLAEAGASVYFKPYEDSDGEWVYAGITPFTAPVDAPRGTLRLKVTKPGFRTGYFAVANPGPSVANDPPNPLMVNRKLSTVTLPLVADGVLDDDMVLVPRTDIPVFFSGWSTDMSGGNFSQEMPAFAIGRHEVTNQEFKDFIDAGGYDDPSYWVALGFEEDGRKLSWANARAKFVDSTGRPGPAAWQLSTYPTGQADFPVAGISWYEAVAYARFRKQSLPTIHHWVRAAFGPYDPHFNVAPLIGASSRFSAEGPLSARAEIGLGPWGTYQMAGNVREWVWNFSGSDTADGSAHAPQGLALGGAWSDYSAQSQMTQSAQPMSRLPTIGLRLMHVLPGDAMSEASLRPIELIVDQPGARRAPVSDDAFEAMRFQFTTTHVKPIEVRVQEIERSPLWIAEEVILEFPDKEFATLFVVRPRSAHKPMQPIIYSPAQDCCSFKRPNRKTLDQLRVAGFIVNSGRALVMPIWLGSYERVVPGNPDPAATADRQRRAALGWHRDLTIALDYVATRDDMDAQKIGYFGVSRGAAYTPITLALDDRVKAAVLLSGGIDIVLKPHPMIDIINYAPRIATPVLMINGRFDHQYPYELSQRRLFDLLGAPADRKEHLVYDSGHFSYPPNSVARDTSNWFDRQLGAAR